VTNDVINNVGSTLPLALTENGTLSFYNNPVFGILYYYILKDGFINDRVTIDFAEKVNISGENVFNYSIIYVPSSDHSIF